MDFDVPRSGDQNFSRGLLGLRIKAIIPEAASTRAMLRIPNRKLRKPEMSGTE
jgi:hypothetical protein